MNLPNKITMARFGCVLVLIGAAAVPETAAHHLLVWRLGFGVAVVGGITDWVDGYLARKHNQVTDFGKLMDPLMDKILTVTGFVIFTERGICPAWVTAVIAIREFAVTGLRALAGKKGVVIAASWAAKCKTVFQMLVLLVAGMIWTELPPTSPAWAASVWWHVLLAVLTAYTLYTGIEYYWKGRELYAHDV